MRRPLLTRVLSVATLLAVPLALAGAAAPADASTKVRCGGKKATIVVTSHSRHLVRGTSHRDVIAVLAAGHVVDGRGGNDLICGSRGRDVLRGSSGDDLILAGAGNDTVTGGSGDDDLRGGTGNDRISGDDGEDRLCGDDGADHVDGGHGADDLLTGDDDAVDDDDSDSHRHSGSDD